MWAFLPAAFAAAGLALLPLRAWDFWWHAALGRVAALTGSIPTAAHVLYTVPAETESLVQPWLAQRIFYEIEMMGGVPLALVVRNLLVGVLFLFVSRWVVARAGSGVAGALHALAAAALLVVPVLDLEPALLAWPIFAALLGLGYLSRSGRWRRLGPALFPVAAAVWVNLDPWFSIPALLAFVFAAAEWWTPSGKRRSLGDVGWWAAACLASLAAIGLNPHGFEVLIHQGTVHAHPVLHELPTAWAPVAPGRFPAVAFPFYAALLAGMAMVVVGRRKLGLVDWLLFAIFGLMALFASGALYWFAIVWAVCLAPAWRGLESTPEMPLIPAPLAAVVVVLAVVLAGALQPTTKYHPELLVKASPVEVRDHYPLKGVVPSETPVEAVEILRQSRAAPRIFHDRRFAGFILYHLHRAAPERILFADPRIELLSPAMWKLYDMVLESNVWRGVFQQYGVGVAMLDTERQKRLIDALEESGDWKMIVESNDHVMFISRQAAGAS